mgnify:CR=1 FL=1
MKTIEAPLTVILIVLFLGFTTKNYVDNIKLEKERSEKAIELAKQAKEDAIAEAAEKARLEERLSKTIRVVVNHDFDPETNTYPVTISSTGSNDPDGDKINYSWTQINGEEIQITGSKTPEISFNAEAGEYEFTLTLTDNYGASCEEYVIVSVGDEPNACPIPVINY